MCIPMVPVAMATIILIQLLVVLSFIIVAVAMCTCAVACLSLLDKQLWGLTGSPRATVASH